MSENVNFEAIECHLPNGTRYSVRQSTPDHAERVIDAINTVAAEHVYLRTDRYVPTHGWERVLRYPLAPESREFLLLIAESEGQIFGWCRLFPFHLDQKSRHVGDVGIGVLREFRRQGIGTNLLTRALSGGQGYGIKKLIAEGYATNEAAIRFFEKMGFAQCGLRRNQFWLDDNYVDEYLMERIL